MYHGILLPLAPGDVVRDGDGIRVLISDRAQAARRLAAAINKNESAAIATMKNISSAQSQCQASGRIDANSNGAGEYGFFGELSGACRLRADAAGGVGVEKMKRALLPAAFATVTGSRLVRCGYLFQSLLPNAMLEATAEAPTGGAKGVRVDPKAAERYWCCYAWPLDHGNTGKRAFFVDQNGDVLATRNVGGRYNGPVKAPKPGAARRGDASPKLDARRAATASAGP